MGLRSGEHGIDTICSLDWRKQSMDITCQQENVSPVFDNHFPSVTSQYKLLCTENLKMYFPILINATNMIRGSVFLVSAFTANAGI